MTPLNKIRIKEFIPVIDYGSPDEGLRILQENASYWHSEGGMSNSRGEQLSQAILFNYQVQVW